MSITRLTTNGLTGTKYDTVSADNYYMEPIATTLVGAGGVSTVTFSNIPQGYKHLQVRIFARYNGAGNSQIPIRFNSDSSASYSDHNLRGNGTAASSGVDISGTATYIDRIASTSETAGVFSGIILDILDYANTNKFKTIRAIGGYDNNGSGYSSLSSGLWQNTAAINTILFNIAFTQYSRLSLYGIKG